jgi:hypothetical protein
MTGAVSSAASSSPAPLGTLASQLGYQPSTAEVQTAARAAMGQAWTDRATPEHCALVAALSATDATASELHYLLLAACGAADIAGRAIGWLSDRFPDDAVVEVSAIRANGGRFSIHGRLSEPDDRAAITAFVAKWWGLANLYYGVNPRSPHMLGTSKVGSGADIASRHQVVFDHDGAPLGPGQRERWEQETLAKHQRDAIASVVRSGNGLQVVYDVDVEADIASIHASQALLKRLYAAAGADTSVANADRVFRLPFTLNIPSASKRRAGRTLVLATVHPEFV